MVWLASELMFFAGLFAMYFTIRSVAGPLWADRTSHLEVGFAFANTLVLVISSLAAFAFAAIHPVRSADGLDPVGHLLLPPASFSI